MVTSERTTEETTDVVVVGGGLAGLAAATVAARAGRRVVLLDAAGLGGRARTAVRDGFSLNMGPHALYRGGEAERVLDSLGVRPTGSPPPTDGAGARGGEPVPMGATPLGLLRSPAFGARAKVAIARFLLAVRRAEPDELRHRTVAAWLADLGVRGAAAELALAAIRVGTYTDAPDLLSADAAATQLQLTLGAGVRYLDGGWGPSLVDALAERAVAAGVQLHRGTRATSVEPGGGSGATVRATGAVWRAAAVVVAAGTPDAAAGLLGDRPAAWSGLTPPATASCLDLGLRRSPERPVVIGLDEPTYCSLHGPPARLAPAGAAVVHVAHYHRPGDERPEPGAERSFLEALARRAGVGDDDVVTSRFLPAMVVAGSVPTPATGGLAGRPPVEVAAHPGVFVAGDWVGPVGLLADAALASGADAGRRAAGVPSATLVAP